MDNEIELLNELIESFENIAAATKRHSDETAKEYQNKANTLKRVKDKIKQ